MTDPNMPPENPIVAVTICLIILGAFPLAIWVAVTWTKQRWAAIWATIKHPPSHAAKTYKECVSELYVDLEAFEKGEIR